MYMFLSTLAEEATHLFTQQRRVVRFVEQTSTIDARGLYVSSALEVQGRSSSLATSYFSFKEFGKHLCDVVAAAGRCPRPHIECLDLSECVLLNEDVLLTKALCIAGLSNSSLVVVLSNTRLVTCRTAAGKTSS